MIALIVLTPILAVSLVPNNQIFNAYLIWADRQFDLYFFTFKVPTTWLVALDAIVSVSFLAGVPLFYRWYGKRWTVPDEMTKIIIGSIFSIGGTLCLFVAASTQGPGQKIGLFWPVAFHFVNSIGFAHMLPITLAFFARLAPKAINATMIGIYYLAFFAANKMVGKIGALLETMPVPKFWLLHAGLAAGAGVCFVIFKFAAGRTLKLDAAEAA